MKITSLLDDIANGRILDAQEANRLMTIVVCNELNDAQLAALLCALRFRPIYVDELEGFTQAIIAQAIPINLPENAIDMCGTGGDMKGTFNISTLASLLVASMGYPVVKHGNYGSTSASGSSNILEHIGYKLTNDNESLKNNLEKYGFCYLHAPLFHTSLKTIASIRRQLGIKTIFNFLGPLINPANPLYRFHGAYEAGIVRVYASFFAKQRKKYAVYHTIGGYDEISCTGSYIYYTNNEKALHHPDKIIDPAVIYGGKDAQQAFAIADKIIRGKGTSTQHYVVCTNATRAIMLYQQKNDYFDAVYSNCLEHIESGKLWQWVQKLTSNN